MMTSTHNVTRNISYFPRTICTMTSFYYYDQNPSGFCFLVQIRAFVIQTSLGLQNKYERKNEKDYGRSSKMTPLCKWLIV